ncbi:MAG: alpha-galactosidase [Bacteroidetes bacterium]|nr:alpha-galactosidase [Bacteroidota bacterium]
MRSIRRLIRVITPLFFPCLLFSQQVITQQTSAGTSLQFTLDNGRVIQKIVFDNNALVADSLISRAEPTREKDHGNGSLPTASLPNSMLETDADFELNIVWTDWQAPGRKNNGDNPVTFGKKDFRLMKHNIREDKDGSKEILFTLVSGETALQVTLIYRLSPGDFYSRRKVAVCDTFQSVHFLQTISARKGRAVLLSPGDDPTHRLILLNPGGFGQPAAFRTGKAGAFTGLEYPASRNKVSPDNNQLILDFSLDYGEKLSATPIESEWVVEALTPGSSVESWFFDYVKDIRVAPAEPFTLYNSWYDLRSPEYPRVEPVNVMNQENVFRIIDLFRKNMIDKHHIHMDAFVLDDGWDIYQSDWVLRKETFPNGLKPLADKLKTLGAGLGVWFGPTGGYSFRMKRVDWMKEHGYEVVGKGRDYSMLCLGGKNYSALFEKRVSDMVVNEGVSYFKWDGIQFSCSEPDHGHPVGIYSRRAILESLIHKCRAVRKLNPATYLNITSGTWLSPWWVKYANQIWMDGGDYGFADVPSINMRDAAITYRDFVLYDDFTNKGLWFPVANLMTHGIIKGNLENVGGGNDPIDKFTNDAVLYFARGISMFELYISPDLLSDQEWDVLGDAINWAKEKKDILAKTFMIGGNPTKGECYGYVHFKDDQGILGVRNPVADPSRIMIPLDAAYGLAPGASGLVVEAVYPYRYIFPRLFRAGDSVDVALDGFETAILEVYPMPMAGSPLPAGVRFELEPDSANDWTMNIYFPSPHAVFLNPASVTSMKREGQPLNSLKDLPMPRLAAPARLVSATAIGGGDPFNGITVAIADNATGAKISCLLKPAPGYKGKDLPVLTGLVDGKETVLQVEKEKGSWYWVTMPLSPGEHVVRLSQVKGIVSENWEGTYSVWVMVQTHSEPIRITLTSPLPRPVKRSFPPLPFPPGVSVKNMKLSEGNISLSPKN